MSIIFFPVSTSLQTSEALFIYNGFIFGIVNGGDGPQSLNDIVLGDDVADIIGVINQAAVSDGHNGLVIDPRVFRENGKEVNLEVNSKKSKSAPKPMKYKEKGTDRAKSRYNHQMGFARKMSEYKISTNDDIFVAFHQSTNNSSKSSNVVKVSTKKRLV